MLSRRIKTSSPCIKSAAGRNRIAGNTFAMAEGALVLATLIQSYQTTRPTPGTIVNVATNARLL